MLKERTRQAQHQVARLGATHHVGAGTRLSQGLSDTNTLKRLRRLRETGVIKRDVEEELIDAYLLFVKFRLKNQLEQPENPTSNHISPEEIGAEDAGRFAIDEGGRVVPEIYQRGLVVRTTVVRGHMKVAEVNEQRRGHVPSFGKADGDYQQVLSSST